MFLSKNQYDFKSKRATKDAVTAFLSKALDEGEKVLDIFLDLAKAFDTVDHSLFFKVLRYKWILLKLVQKLS